MTPDQSESRRYVPIEDADRLAAALESALFAFAVAHKGAEPGEATQVLLDYRRKRAEGFYDERAEEDGLCRNCGGKGCERCDVKCAFDEERTSE